MSKINYNAKSLKVLKGLDAVRKRPGMYIGSTNSDGLHHLIWEIFDNSIDEVLAGFADKIWLTIDKNNVVSVEDNGRGIPIDIHKSSKKTGVELIFSELHSGGKFEEGPYKTSGGLHGVGASVVNALSTFVVIEVYRQNKVYLTKFKDQKLVEKTHEVGLTYKKGSKISFLFDKDIFVDVNFDSELICQKLKQASYLIPNLNIYFKDQKNEKNYHFYSQKGILDFIKNLNSTKKIVHEKPFFVSHKTQNITLEIALQFNFSSETNIFSFVNNVNTNDGGTHENGFKNCLLKVINQYGVEKNFLKAKQVLTYNDIKEGLVAIISLKIPEKILEFVGQTKSKLGTAAAKNAVEVTLNHALINWFNQNKDQTKAIYEKIINVFEYRQAAKQLKIVSQKTKSKSEKKFYSKKLINCQTKKPAEREIFLVEGDSAGGSAKMGRNPLNQAILALRGKVINVEKTKIMEVLKNEEILTIINVLGTGINQNFDYQKLQYHKVIIMTDADNDGAHIQSLLLTFFYRYMKPLILNGHLFIAYPPLYKITFSQNKNDYIYCWNEQQLKSSIANRKNYVIQRYKGLGEMNAKQLAETTMNPLNRNLVQVKINDLEKAEKQVVILMGSDTEMRKKWINNNIDFSLSDNFLDQYDFKK